MNEKELQRLSQQAARVGMDAGTTVEAFRRLTEAFRRFPEMPMPTRELANNSSEVDRDNDELISRREATQTALDFIVEYLGGAFDEDFQKKLMERMNALPSAEPEYEPVKAEDFAKTMSENTIYGFMAWHGEALALMERQGFVICKKHCL